MKDTKSKGKATPKNEEVVLKDTVASVTKPATEPKNDVAKVTEEKNEVEKVERPVERKGIFMKKWL